MALVIPLVMRPHACDDKSDRTRLSPSTRDTVADAVVANIVRGPSGEGEAVAVAAIVRDARGKIQQREEEVKGCAAGQWVQSDKSWCQEWRVESGPNRGCCH